MAIFMVGPDADLIGETLYMLIHDDQARVWNGSAFVTYDDTDRATYAIAMTPGADETSLFTATIPAALTGSTYMPTAFIQDGGSPALTDATAREGTLNWSGTGVITLYSISQQLVAIAAQLAAAVVVVSSPVDTDGNISIVQGDDYTAATGRPLTWTVLTSSLPSLSGASVSLGLVTTPNYNATAFSNPALTQAGTITEVGANTVFTVELTDTQTAALATSVTANCPSYVFQLRVQLASGLFISIQIGTATITKRVLAQP
jgi:hypothetical protein